MDYKLEKPYQRRIFMRNRAFTFMEIMSVVVIFGVLASVAVPRYLRTMEIQRSRSAVNHVRTIGAAVQMFLVARVLPACGGWCDTGQINANFGLAIPDPDPDFNYRVQCQPGNIAWTVEGVRNGGPVNYTLQIRDINPNNVICLGAGCNFINM